MTQYLRLLLYPQDIQIRGVNRDENNISMAKKHPNSKHFLTYRHSLRVKQQLLHSNAFCLVLISYAQLFSFYTILVSFS